MTDLATVIHLLDEARGFAALSPAGRENISEAIDILETLDTRPDAPVEGLDTELWATYAQDGRMIYTTANAPESGVTEYVTRSQAEAIIAAKDELIKELEENKQDNVWENCSFYLRGGDYLAFGATDQTEEHTKFYYGDGKIGSTDERKTYYGLIGEGDRVFVTDKGINAKDLVIITKKLYNDQLNNLRADNAALTAPVEGLERYKYNPYSNHGCAASIMEINPLGEYVRFDQAEAIIAAERKAEQATFEIAARLLKEKEAIQAYNAALTARVKELAEINANLMGDDEEKPRYTTKRLKLEIARATEALETQLAAARKASP